MLAVLQAGFTRPDVRDFTKSIPPRGIAYELEELARRGDGVRDICGLPVDR
jgi:hypothetical protein